VRFQLIVLLLSASSAVYASGCAGTTAPALPASYAVPAAAAVRGAGQATNAYLLDREVSTTPYAYGCDGVATCDIFNKFGHIIGSIALPYPPGGTATDAAGNWYIVEPEARTILEYSAAGGTLENTLQDPGQVPYDVAISEATNTVAVGNASNSISVYVGGATTPTRILEDPQRERTLAMTVDAKGSCYTAYDIGSGSEIGVIDKFDGCSGKPHRVGPEDYFQGIAFDGAGNLYYSEIGASSGAVFKCKHVTIECDGIYEPIYALPTVIRFNARFSTLIVVEAFGPPVVLLGSKGSHKVKPFTTQTESTVTFAVGPA
jgi:DNA-binding beta-propeller fold protein YncE